MSDKGKSFWQTVPGIMSGIAAIITALTGVVVVVRGLGVGQPSAIPETVTATSTYIASATPIETPTDSAEPAEAPTDTVCPLRRRCLHLLPPYLRRRHRLPQ